MKEKYRRNKCLSKKRTLQSIPWKCKGFASPQLTAFPLLCEPSPVDDPVSLPTGLDQETHHTASLLAGLNDSLTRLREHLIEEFAQMNALRDFIAEEFTKLHGRIHHLEYAIVKLQSVVKSLDIIAPPSTTILDAAAAEPSSLSPSGK